MFRFASRMMPLAYLSVLVFAFQAFPLKAEPPINVVTSQVNDKAWIKGSMAHYAFGVESLEDLRELLPELGRLAPGKKINIVWIDPNDVSSEIKQTIQNNAPVETASVSYISMAKLDADALAEEIAAQASSSSEDSPAVRGFLASTKNFLAGYQKWATESASTASTYLVEHDVKDQTKLDRAANYVGYLKSSGSFTIWIYNALSSHSKLAAGAVAINIASKVATGFAVGSGFFLDWFFQRYAEKYVDFKRSLKFEVREYHYRPSWYNPVTWGKAALIYSATFANNMISRTPVAPRWNKLSPYVKTFTIDQVVGFGIGSYFRQLASVINPEISGPFASPDFAMEYVAANFFPAVIGSSGDVAVSQLMDKKIIPKYLRWAFLQAWGMSFWARNSIVNAGLTKIPGWESFWAGALTFITAAEVGTKIGFIALNTLVPPLSREAKVRSTMLNPTQSDELNVRIFAPNLPAEEKSSVLALSKISPQDIGRPKDGRRIMNAATLRETCAGGFL